MSDTNEVKLSIQFNAPVERLYAAWYKTELLQQWFAPGEMLVGQMMSSFVEGGKFRVVMQQPDGEQHIVMGEYLEILPAQKLVFSWQWVGEGEVTQVSLLFKALNDTTSELSLRHSGFNDEQTTQMHQNGWIGCLEKLSLITL
jgi:uncharacterized protein YndB with AHSA1/START domain